jgi:predicted nucleotidyltransferase
MKSAFLTPLLLVQKHLQGTGYAAFLFGSRAGGNPHPGSDWDIAITGTKRLDPILLMKIEEAIEQANFTEAVDLVDMFTASSALQRELNAFM